jgi:hypothetical protein
MTAFSHSAWILEVRNELKTKTIKRIIAEAGSHIVSVEFIKRDGTKRQLCFNPRDTQEVKGTGTSSTKPGVIRCRDFTIARSKGEGAWRSFDCERVTRLVSKGFVHSFSDNTALPF